ncbi:adenylate/guanylate cyclase domain-containing protein [Parasedimentitalea psychrophila]|uniref:Adenylate/guanylate cyclase domain-containing protein n=1 Tax=Parasedimentitalea psychrophila TaxID=2997337 RepID=A0A9Y2P554_9RHOB|nr:adenylate/guanylate cyclase domain-containing protein [Parasedimentitalea psychrophila]WIY23628.1 adenylate/guanylate cyclase domain-containing protein [Parasedimentitalea psychrophila]
MSRTLQDLLSAHGLNDLVELFAVEKIDPSMVHDLTDDDLKEIGLKLGQRKRFRAAINTETVPFPARPRMPAERRQLTVAFIDLVDSTTLATTLDPEDLREVITSYLDIAVATMKAHGGFLAYTQGDGLMVYFGYPVAQEDDPSRAIRAALATAAVVQGMETLAPNPLKVRIGVATGRVVVGDMPGDSATPRDFVVGETPNLATRMQSLANPGEVVVAEATQHLTSGTFDFDARGSVLVKGFGELRTVFAVIRETTGKSRFDAHAVDGVQSIVGREAELKTLAGYWDAACAGNGNICLIEGPPGIGKSRLVRGIYSLAGRAAVEWQCAPHLTNRALHPMVAELERDAGIKRSDTADIRQAKAAALIADTQGLSEADLPYLASLVSAPMENGAQLEAQVRARLTFEALKRRVEGMTTLGPVLVVLEDAHWADPTTLEFLDLLSEHIADLPLLLLVTFRPRFTPSDTLKSSGETLILEPLDPDAGIALVNNIGGEGTLPVVLARRIIEKTDGVPLFIEELTKSILDAALDDDAVMAESHDVVDIPTTLQALLMSRLDRTGVAKEVAQLGAVIGREFTVQMINAIAPVGSDLDVSFQLLEGSELLHRGGLLGPEYFVFNHALVQDTAYESMLRSRRQEVHLALALAMLNGEPAFGVQEPETIARHCEFGGLIEEAIEYWTLAGHEAMDRVANLAALAHFTSALHLLENQPEGSKREDSELGIQMALMAVSMSIYGWGSSKVADAAFRSRDIARSLNNGEALYGATWGIWTMHFLRGELVHGINVAQEVSNMADAVGAPLLLTTADHAVCYTQYYRGELREAFDRYVLGMSRFDPAVDVEIMKNFQITSGLALMDSGAASAWLMGREAEAVEGMQQMLSYMDQLDHSPSYAYGLGALGHFSMVQRNWARMAEVAEQNKALSSDLGYLMWERVADLQLVISRAYLDNKLAESVDQARTAQDQFTASGTRLTELLSIPPVVEMMIAADRAEDGLKLVEDRIARALKHHERLNLADLYRARGLAFQALGDLKRAQGDLEIARKIAQAQGAVKLVERAELQLKELVA